jgi:hypothetical protein
MLSPLRTTVALLALGLVSSAAADMVLLEPPRQAERNITNILTDYLGLDEAWTQLGNRIDVGGLPTDWQSGDVQIRRVDDTGYDVPLDVHGSNLAATDQVWFGSGLLEIETVARYGRYRQQLGLDLLDDEAGAFNLFTVAGSGRDAHGAATYDLPLNSRFAWRRSGGGPTVYSQTSRNRDQGDHLVTYALQGLGDERAHWILMWEDKPGLGDRDYNDLVVHVSAGAVPEPGSLVLLVAGVLAASLRRR